MYFAGNCISHGQIAGSIGGRLSNLLDFPRLGSGHIACVVVPSMRSVSSLLFVLAFSAGTIASLPCVCAKDSIAKGDQHAALHGLLAARSQLRSCEERDNDSATDAVAIAPNSPRPSS